MNEEIIIKEMRKQTQFTKWFSIGALTLLVLFMFIYPKVSVELTKKYRTQAKPGPSWTQVSNLMDRAEFEQALKMANELLTKSPNYDYAHSWVASIYLAMHDLKNAENYYARAFELFPSEDNEKMLSAIRKAR